VALSVAGVGLPERRLAFLDKSRDLYLTPVTPLPGYTQLAQAKFKLQVR
jgi:hypothetical protein